MTPHEKDKNNKLRQRGSTVTIAKNRNFVRRKNSPESAGKHHPRALKTRLSRRAQAGADIAGENHQRVLVQDCASLARRKCAHPFKHAQRLQRVQTSTGRHSL